MTQQELMMERLVTAAERTADLLAEISDALEEIRGDVENITRGIEGDILLPGPVHGRPL